MSGSIYQILIRDLELMAYLGVYDHEKKSQQRVLINVDLCVAAGVEAVLHDDIAQVVSYEQLINRISQLFEQGHINLIETVAEHIAAVCLEDTRILSVRVKVEKPDIIKNVRSVGIEIERQQRGKTSICGVS